MPHIVTWTEERVYFRDLHSREVMAPTRQSSLRRSHSGSLRNVRAAAHEKAGLIFFASVMFQELGRQKMLKGERKYLSRAAWPLGTPSVRILLPLRLTLRRLQSPLSFLENSISFSP